MIDDVLDKWVKVDLDKNDMNLNLTTQNLKLTDLDLEKYEKQLFESIGKLYKKDLPNGTRVIHGHGMETSIGWLKKRNKFFG